MSPAARQFIACDTQGPSHVSWHQDIPSVTNPRPLAGKPINDVEWGRLIDVVTQVSSAEEAGAITGQSSGNIRRWLLDHPEQLRRAAALVRYECWQVACSMLNGWREMSSNDLDTCIAELKKLQNRWVLRYWAQFVEKHPGRLDRANIAPEKRTGHKLAP